MTKSPKNRKVTIRHDPRYWRVLGQFIEAFSLLEHSFFDSLCFYAGVDRKMGVALFSGTRVEAAIQYIGRILDTNPIAPGRRTDLETIFKQAKAINGIRNKIIHYGSFVTSDKGRITSTISRALLPSRVEEYRVSISIIKAMTTDITLICTSLYWDKLANDPSKTQITPILLDPWRYKPEPPNPPQRAARGKKQDQHHG